MFKQEAALFRKDRTAQAAGDLQRNSRISQILLQDLGNSTGRLRSLTQCRRLSCLNSRIFLFSLISLCLVLLRFDPCRDNERPRRNTSHVKRQTAKPNLEENVPTPGSRANQLQSDRLPSFLLRPESRSAAGQVRIFRRK